MGRMRVDAPTLWIKIPPPPRAHDAAAEFIKWRGGQEQKDKLRSLSGALSRNGSLSDKGKKEGVDKGWRAGERNRGTNGDKREESGGEEDPRLRWE